MTKSRRQFLRSLGTGAVVLSLGTLTRHGVALAADPMVDPADPLAKSMEYTHTGADASKLCSNCQLYTGAAGAESGPCGIFPGKVVSAKGWCKAWVAKS